MKKKLLFVLALVLFVGSLTVAFTLPIHAEGETTTTQEVAEPKNEEGEEPEATEEKSEEEKPTEEQKEVAPTIQDKRKDFADKWLSPIVSAISGVSGIILGVLLVLSRLTTIVANFKKTHEINQEEVAKLKEDYENSKKQVAEEKESLVFLGNGLRKDASELLKITLEDQKTKCDLMKLVGIMMSSIPQFVASGKAEELQKLINSNIEKRRPIVEEIVDRIEIFDEPIIEEHEEEIKEDIVEDTEEQKGE